MKSDATRRNSHSRLKTDGGEERTVVVTHSAYIRRALYLISFHIFFRACTHSRLEHTSPMMLVDDQIQSVGIKSTGEFENIWQNVIRENVVDRHTLRQFKAYVAYEASGKRETAKRTRRREETFKFSFSVLSCFLFLFSISQKNCIDMCFEEIHRRYLRSTLGRGGWLRMCDDHRAIMGMCAEDRCLEARKCWGLHEKKERDSRFCC